MMFGRAIREMRVARGLTLAELGEMCGGVTHVTMSRYERGDRQPSPAMVQGIADALGTTVEELRELEQSLIQGSGGSDRRYGLPDEPQEYVSSQSDISTWRDQVIRDPSLEPWPQMILMALPIFLDKTSWVAPITVEQFSRETGRTLALVEQHWPAVLDSGYVDRLGENEWTFRLKFPPK